MLKVTDQCPPKMVKLARNADLKGMLAVLCYKYRKFSFRLTYNGYSSLELWMRENGSERVIAKQRV